MSRKILIALALIALGAIVGSGLVSLIRPAAAQPAAAAGPYRVVAADSSYVLYDATSSKSWLLTPKRGELSHAWLPIKRLDTNADVYGWKARKSAME